MVDLDNGQNECSTIPDLTPYSAVAIGPGIGMSREATNAVRLILQEAKVPLVIDADALNILAEQKTWQAFIPAGSILTPHPREFERLAGKAANGFEKLQLLRDFCLRHRVYVVLKGAHTITCSPGGNCFFNSTGNPGMATGGSGDVLTGIILGLLAQHYAPVEACLLGVYLHGLSGDMIAAVSAQESMVAGDLVEGLGQAFRTLY
jgi:NAD(P)H-hydrate epimerase